MNTLIAYDSKHGNTKKAAENIHKYLSDSGKKAIIKSVEDVTDADIKNAEKLVLGCWTMGLLIIFQHPSTPFLDFIKRVKDLKNKQIYLFCTYKIAIGKTLEKMSSPVIEKGGNVIGQFKLRTPDAIAELTACL